MDASAIMNTMCDTWVKLLEEYYESITESYASHLAQEFELDKDHILLSVGNLKGSLIGDVRAKFITANTNQQNIKKSTPKTIKKPFFALPSPSPPPLCLASLLCRKNQSKIAFDAYGPKPVLLHSGFLVMGQKLKIGTPAKSHCRRSAPSFQAISREETTLISSSFSIVESSTSTTATEGCLQASPNASAPYISTR